MKNQAKLLRSGIAVFLFAFALTGCGKEENPSPQTSMNQTGNTGIEESDKGATDLEQDTSAEDEGSWNGNTYKFELDGENGALLNGKITSIILADDSWVYASTADGSLFMLSPSIYYDPEDSEIKSYHITDDCGINELVYANQHMAYGNGHFVYFDIMEGYEDIDDVYALDSYALPEVGYTFENMQKAALSDDQNLIFATDDAAFYLYEDIGHHVRAGYKDSYSEEYTMYSDVAFEGDTERSDITVNKSIFRFLLTGENELFYIDKANILSDLADNVNGVSVSYVDLTDRIDAKVTDIYNLQNNTECCYAVDEGQNIYYVSTVDLNNITVEKITQFESGTIVDIKGFAGTNDEMLIKTEEGIYYFYDGDSYTQTRKIDALDGNYKNAELLMEGDILALGNDGYLYVVEDKN